MAEPVSTAIGMFAKKVVVEALSEPEKILKYILCGVFLPLLALILILALPIILIMSLPAIMLDGNTSPEDTMKQLEIIAMYQDAPIQVSNDAMEWIDDKKRQYSWCDDIRVSYSFDLTWQDLMAIDSVKLGQDFSKAKQKDIKDLGHKFIQKSTRTETYKVEETYRVKKTYYVTRTDAQGNTKRVKKSRWVTRTRIVTKHRAIISLSTKSFYQVLDEIGFNTFDKDLATNIYTTILGYDVEGNLNIYDDVDLSDLKEYPPGNANVPYFNQTDKRWAASSYGNSTIYSGGCAPTALAMVVSGLTGRNDITPHVVANWSVANGHRAEGIGSYWSLITAGGEYYGLDVERVSRRNPNKIVKALSDGHPVIVAMGRGHFTRGGHFIVLRGITENGKILVYDPASTKRTNTPWDVGIIMNESSTKDGVNGHPFWILKK